MSYWPGELVQTLSINGNQLSINPGNTVTLPGGSSVSSFNQASISSLTVSSINGVKPENLDVAAWSEFSAISSINVDGNDMLNVASLYSEAGQPIYITTNGLADINFRTNSFDAMTISSNQKTIFSGEMIVNASINAPVINTSSINLSTINGLPYTPGITSTISTFNELYTSSLNASTVTTNTLTAISTINVISTISTAQIQTDNVFTSSLITSSIAAQDININFNFNANITTTSTLNVSNTTNLANVNANTISTVNLTTTGNTIFTDSYSGTLTVGGPAFFGSSINMVGEDNYLEIGKNSVRVLAPTFGYNDVYLEANLKVGDPGALTGPDIELYPNEFTMGDALHPISGGISMTAGTTISLYSPLINMLGANVAIGAGNIIIGSGAIEIGSGNITIGTSTTPGGGMNVYGGKIFAGPSALGPPSGNGGIVVQDESDLQANAIRSGNLGYLLIESQTPGSNNISINDISQLTSDGAGMLQQNVGQIVGNASNFAITNVSSINGSAYPPSFAVPSNLQVSTLNVNDGFGNFHTNGTGTTITVPSTVTITNALVQQNSSFSTIQRFSQVMLPNLGDVEFAYDIIPPGFPSTTMGKLIFSSTINGGSGGVKIQSQFGDAKQLAVNGDGVYASDLITGSNSDYPLLVQVPDLDQFVLLGMSTMGAGVGKCEVINTTTTNTGQLTLSAPNTSTLGSSRIMILDSLNSAVGINNAAPQAPLDVGGLNYASAGSVGIFGGDKDGTLEVTLQNKSAGSNASAFFFAVENTGGEYAGFGVNSMNLSNLYSTLFELPGASIQSGTLDCVIGPQSDHSSNSGIYLTYQDGAFAHHINSNGALSFNASYDGTVVNEGNFGASNSLLVTNGSGAAPTWTNNVVLNSVSVSTLTVNSNVEFTTTSFTNKKLVSGGLSNSGILTTDVLASPYIDTVTYIQPFTNSNAAAGYIVGAADNRLWGINKIPEPGFILDVDSTIRTKVFHASGQVLTSSIMSPSTFVEVKSLTGEVSLTPNPSWWVGINSGVVAGDNQGLIKFGNSEVGITGYNGLENYIANQYYPGSYAGGSWTNYVGRAVRVEYAVTTDSSFGGGLGKAEFILPVGLSTLASAQGTYVAFGDSSPGLTHPIWLYSTINDGNGQISTIQMGGGQNTDLFVSVLGYV